MSFFKGKTKKCFASGCEEQIPVRMLMCRKHWDMVPSSIQFAVYNTLAIWQQGGDPHLYTKTIKRAAAAVAQKEARLNERKAIHETEETHPADRLQRESNVRPPLPVHDLEFRRHLRDQRR
jgi:hypothetical protein